jgi:hypothetical protein
MPSLRQRLDLPPIGLPAFCLALGLVSGFLAGRDWSAKAIPASNGTVAELTEKLDALLPEVMLANTVVEELLVNLPPNEVEGNVARLVGLPALGVAATPNTERTVNVGDYVLLSADQRGRVYAICEPQP